LKNQFVINLLTKPRNYDDINGNRNGNKNGINIEIRIGIWNTRTLYQFGVLKNETEKLKKYKIPIVAPWTMGTTDYSALTLGHFII